MTLRRGFKSGAHAIAREVRDELGLRPADPLDVHALAEYLEVPVLPLSQLQTVEPVAVRHFLGLNPGAFSAVTIFRGSARTIWHNDAHSDGRQAANIAHELAHALLLHQPGPALGPDRMRAWDPIMEEEVQWLGGALLISDEAAFRIVATGMEPDHAAAVYGVSKPMLDFRLRVTGATLRVARARALRPSSTRA